MTPPHISSLLDEGLAVWVPSLSQLIQIYFIVITTAAWLTATLPALRESILTYGKLDALPSNSTKLTTAATPQPSKRTSTSISTLSSSHEPWVAFLKSLKVPKTWFSHFYVFATLWMVYLTLDLALYISSSVMSSFSIPNRFVNVLVSSYPSWSFLTLLNMLGVMPRHSVPDLGTQSPLWTAPLLLLPPEVFIAMSCYFLHVSRRWFETWFVERPSKDAQIHVGHYLIGISFYAAMAPALWVDTFESWARIGERVDWNDVPLVRQSEQPYQQQQLQQQQLGSYVDFMDYLSSIRMQCWIAVVLFLWASWHQHRCHVILANLRKPQGPSRIGSTTTASAAVVISALTSPSAEGNTLQQYKVPFGDWFEYLVAPHYSAEMIMYLALYLMVSSCGKGGQAPTLLVAWVWVVVNLGIVAKETDQWYRTRFGEDYAEPAGTPARNQGQVHIKRKQRAILVPFVY